MGSSGPIDPLAFVRPDPPAIAAMASDGANRRFARHRQLLARWPVQPEPWARAVEEKRLAAIDRTPGAATFGR
ncbi:MAG: hypothetical protein U0237_17410 [Thermoleophilia bacterium]